jgi:hypothetical protein
MTGQEVNEERIVDEFTEVDGVKMAKKMHILRDGKKYLELETEEIKLVDKIDKSEFQKP